MNIVFIIQMTKRHLPLKRRLPLKDQQDNNLLLNRILSIDYTRQKCVHLFKVKPQSYSLSIET